MVLFLIAELLLALWMQFKLYCITFAELNKYCILVKKKKNFWVNATASKEGGASKLCTYSKLT